MTRKLTIWALVMAGTLLLSSCEETGPKQVQVRPPAATPAPPPPALREPLPFPENPIYMASLSGDVRPAIDIVVEQVQASYDAGEEHYKAGDLAKSRTDFDRAVNIILASGLTVDADPRLSKLFDEIGEATQAFEISAFEATEDQEPDSNEGPSQPAPIDEIADLTLPAGDPRLALKAERELITVPHDLPLTVNDSVLQYLSFFTTTKGRAIVEHGLERSGRYNDMIRRVLKEEGVPQDLMYLAQAESAFQPQAVSRAGARGIWQFMPYRGEEYDLERNYWIDERSDPEKATRAAARHMRDLYQMFGDWYLVMAAYNSGPLNVSRAVERTGYADFWELQRLKALPKETQNYVPIIIAMALVAKAPALYGVQVNPQKPDDTEAVRLDHPVDLHIVADATGGDLDNLKMLNPQLLRNVTPNQPGFELRLPAGAAARFQESIEQVPEDKRTAWRLHSVEEGESLADVARHYHVTVPALEVANHLEAHATVPAGFLLNVPTTPPVIRLTHYRVQRGDTLEGIADRFDVTVAELKKWNHLAGTRAPRGANLRIYAGGVGRVAASGSPAETGSGSAAPKTLAAVKSDIGNARASRGTGAKMEDISARAAEKDTEKNADKSAERDSGIGKGSADKTGKVESVQHRVKPGETLYSIARYYRTSVSALKQSNPFLAERGLLAGDVLIVQQ
jgi:membrane-bound lytic murein transglycosylase D